MLKLARSALAGVLLLAAPCTFAQEAQPNPAPAAAPGEASPKVRLIEAGEEPRTQLRYAPEVGSAGTLTLKMKMATDSKMDGRALMKMDMPTMVMVMDIAVKEVRPNGDIAWDMKFTSVDVEAGPNDNPMMVEGMRTSMRSLVGVTASTVISSRGETKSSEFKFPENVDPMSRQMAEGLKSSARQMSSPLPAEPVGKGAKWEVVTNIKNMGVSMDQTSLMTLKDISGPNLTLDIALTQKADRQELSFPGMPAGSKIELVSMNSSGSGTMKATTDSIMPIESTINMTSSQEMTVRQTAEGDPHSMTQDLKLQVTMASGPADKAKTAPQPAPKQ